MYKPKCQFGLFQSHMWKSHLNSFKNVFASVSEMSKDEISNGSSVRKAQYSFL